MLILSISLTSTEVFTRTFTVTNNSSYTIPCSLINPSNGGNTPTNIAPRSSFTINPPNDDPMNAYRYRIRFSAVNGVTFSSNDIQAASWTGNLSVTISDPQLCYTTAARTGFRIINNSSSEVTLKRGSSTSTIATIAANSEQIISFPANMGDSANATLRNSTDNILIQESKGSVTSNNKTWIVSSDGSVNSTGVNHAIIWNLLANSIQVRRVEDGVTRKFSLTANSATYIATDGVSSFSFSDSNGSEIPIATGSNAFSQAGQNIRFIVQQQLQITQN